MPKPGYIPSLTEFDDDCVRQALACASGIALNCLPHISCAELTGLSPSDIDAIWQAIMKVFGWDFYLDDAVDVGGGHFWIATVNDSTRSCWHTVVMRGRDLWFDPERSRVRRPTKFHEKWCLEPCA